mmetsp:Transcript_10952/g.27326  ORF Transcript_10952/g.27326 Transcript_10952/m.27326 type:complete len:307 (-) Transcript_10952:115-1035(-)
MAAATASPRRRCCCRGAGRTPPPSAPSSSRSCARSPPRPATTRAAGRAAPRSPRATARSMPHPCRPARRARAWAATRRTRCSSSSVARSRRQASMATCSHARPSAPCWRSPSWARTKPPPPRPTTSPLWPRPSPARRRWPAASRARSSRPPPPTRTRSSVRSPRCASDASRSTAGRYSATWPLAREPAGGHTRTAARARAAASVATPTATRTSSRLWCAARHSPPRRSSAAPCPHRWSSTRCTQSSPRRPWRARSSGYAGCWRGAPRRASAWQWACWPHRAWHSAQRPDVSPPPRSAPPPFVPSYT